MVSIKKIIEKKRKENRYKHKSLRYITSHVWHVSPPLIFCQSCLQQNQTKASKLCTQEELICHNEHLIFSTILKLRQTLPYGVRTYHLIASSTITYISCIVVNLSKGMFFTISLKVKSTSMSEIFDSYIAQRGLFQI